MCDFPGEWIAWLDGELSEAEAGALQRHLQDCAECRTRVTGYRAVSGAFDLYCEAAVASESRDKLRRLRRGLAACGAAVAVVALFAVLPYGRVARAPMPLPAPMARPLAASEAVPSLQSPAKAIVRERDELPAPAIRRTGTASRRIPGAKLPTTVPVIQIAIPSDAMFPPGAVPEGISFTADIALAADGAVEGLRLQPRPAGFERRSTQP